QFVERPGLAGGGLLGIGDWHGDRRIDRFHRRDQKENQEEEDDIDHGRHVDQVFEVDLHRRADQRRLGRGFGRSGRGGATRGRRRRSRRFQNWFFYRLWFRRRGCDQRRLVRLRFRRLLKPGGWPTIDEPGAFLRREGRSACEVNGTRCFA